MRVGIVSYWFNRGQATVMRTIRAALDEGGHDTFVLARPTKSSFQRPAFADRTGVWDQAGVDTAVAFDIPGEDLVAWARRREVDAVLFFQNVDFDAIDVLSRAGVPSAGTFMWEAFSRADAARAAAAHRLVYSLNAPSGERYRAFGLDRIVEIPFCASPALAGRPDRPRRAGGARFLFAAGYLSARKPLGVVVDAFRKGAPSDASLTVKAQTPLRPGDFIRPVAVESLAGRHRDHAGDIADLLGDDPRIRVVIDDLEERAFLDEMEDHDVVVGVSRWEGLGLHLFECDALGLPLLLNDMPPFDSWVEDGGVAHLVRSTLLGQNAVGVDVHEPDLDDLAAGFAAMAAAGDAWRARARRRASDHPARWSAFRAAVDSMVEQVADA